MAQTKCEVCKEPTPLVRGCGFKCMVRAHEKPMQPVKPRRRKQLAKLRGELKQDEALTEM